MQLVVPVIAWLILQARQGRRSVALSLSELRLRMTNDDMTRDAHSAHPLPMAPASSPR